MTISQNHTTDTTALTELTRSAHEVKRRQDDLEAALVDRNLMIGRAASDGLSRRRIASVVGLSAARVQQICDAAGG